MPIRSDKPAHLRPPIVQKKAELIYLQDDRPVSMHIPSDTHIQASMSSHKMFYASMIETRRMQAGLICLPHLCGSRISCSTGFHHSLKMTRNTMLPTRTSLVSRSHLKQRCRYSTGNITSWDIGVDDTVPLLRMEVQQACLITCIVGQ